MSKNKKGSYIVEAAFSLPVLIIAISSLILIIRIIMVCEGICFSTAEEIKDIIRSPKENFLSVSLCKRIEKKVLSDETALTDFEVKNIDYINLQEGDKHILLQAEGKFSVTNPIGINGSIVFDESIIIRPMRGSLRDESALSEESFLTEKSMKVIVFPKYGEKYHTKGCRYVKRAESEKACRLEMEKVDAGLKGYKPCLVCGGAAND